MKANQISILPEGQPPVEPPVYQPPATLPIDVVAPLGCSTGQCMCKQRLHAAIADAPSRDDELQTLQRYMGKLAE